jgi:alpha-glucosidase
VQDADPDSTLWFYRRALALRHDLQRDEQLDWMAFEDPVVAFGRAEGWASLTNFGSSPVSLPHGTVLIASGELPVAGLLPADTTMWMLVDDGGAEASRVGALRTRSTP